MLELPAFVVDELTALAYDTYPYECCGLLAGRVEASGESVRCDRFFPCRNTAESAKVYTVDPLDHLRAEREAEKQGREIVGVVHSHTHSEPYPSPTDVARAPDPTWHYVIVSLKRESPEVRSYRIIDGEIAEESINVV